MKLWQDDRENHFFLPAKRCHSFRSHESILLVTRQTELGFHRSNSLPYLHPALLHQGSVGVVFHLQVELHSSCIFPRLLPLPGLLQQTLRAPDTHTSTSSTLLSTSQPTGHSSDAFCRKDLHHVQMRHLAPGTQQGFGNRKPFESGCEFRGGQTFWLVGDTMDGEMWEQMECFGG